MSVPYFKTGLILPCSIVVQFKQRDGEQLHVLWDSQYLFKSVGYITLWTERESVDAHSFRASELGTVSCILSAL
jgi:hypothetical protein